MIFTSVFFIHFFCGIIAAATAYSKGRSVTGWFVAGLFLGVIGVFLLVLLPRLKQCPQCGFRVRRDAPICHYCGYDMAERLRQNGVDEYRYCSNCQRAVDKDAVTCPICRAPLD